MKPVTNPELEVIRGSRHTQQDIPGRMTQNGTPRAQGRLEWQIQPSLQPNPTKEEGLPE